MAFWLRADAKPQERKVRVLVYDGNDKSESVVRSVEVKFNSTMRYEVVDGKGHPDLVVSIICNKKADYAWLCSSAVGVVSGNIAVPVLWGNALVSGSSEQMATGIFEYAVNSSSDEHLQAARSSFHHEVYLYCKQFNCSEDVK
jgi:hypothetical protein